MKRHIALCLVLVTAGCLGFVGGSGGGSTPTATPDATASTPHTEVITVTRVVTITRVHTLPAPTETATPTTAPTPTPEPQPDAIESSRPPFGGIKELNYTIIMPKVPKQSRDFHRKQVFEAIDYYEDDYDDYVPTRADYRDSTLVDDTSEAVIVVKIVDDPPKRVETRLEGNNTDPDPALEELSQVTIVLDREMDNGAVGWWVAHELAPVFADDPSVLPEALRKHNTTSKRRSKWWYE
ncbi:MAG: hypothetical protein ABEI76_08605 [Halobacteriales archaeon]